MNLPFDTDIILENDKVLLRPIKPEDWEVLLPIPTATPDLIKYSPTRIHTEEYLKDYIKTALEERQKGSRYIFLIYDKVKGKVAGSTSFLFVSNINKTLEIGATWIGKEFQGSGLNRNCKYLLLQYVFDILEFERVELRTDERNIQSQKAIEKIGAKFEGITRSHIIMTDGYRRSSKVYSILKDEWEKMRDGFLG